MADVRALLAAERQSRRISHPHLTYTKTGALICNICQLNVKSEALWEGHLRSLNHRKSVQKTQEANASKNLKRKLDDVQEEPEETPPVDTERRKMPKSRATSLAEKAAKTQSEEIPAVPSLPTQADAKDPPPPSDTVAEPVPGPAVANDTLVPENPQPAVDEDEWAAFERDIAAVDQVASAPDYSAATISAAPMSAEQLAAQSAVEKRKQQELLAEDEEDEEKGRLEEELEIMEELEDRIRRLKEKREAIRLNAANGGETAGEGDDLGRAEAAAGEDAAQEGNNDSGDDEDDEDDEDEEDDWYG